MSPQIRRAFAYFFRACRLKCVECGTKPIFTPLLKIRSVSDYFAPLDGCPRCGYAYERETGYFLLAIWAINYGIGSLIGISFYWYLELNYRLDLRVLILSVVLPIIAFNILFARHAKAFFLALDHYFDPHGNDDGSDGGGGSGKQNPPPAPVPTVPQTAPVPSEPAVLV